VIHVDRYGNLITNLPAASLPGQRFQARVGDHLAPSVAYYAAAQPNGLQQLPVTLTLTSGSARVDYAAQTTDASGYFTVPVGGLPTGNYTWRSKDPQYLSQSGAVTLTGSPQSSVDMGLMRAGDANNDNLVNLSDFVVLKLTFNSTTDLRADFNGNGIVDAADFTTLKNNYGRGGAFPGDP